MPNQPKSEMGGWLSQPAHSCALTLELPVGKERSICGVSASQQTQTLGSLVFPGGCDSFSENKGFKEEWHNHKGPWMLCNKFLLCAITTTSKPAGRAFSSLAGPTAGTPAHCSLLQLSLEPAAAEMPVQRGLGLPHVEQPLESKQKSIHFPLAIQRKLNFTQTHTPPKGSSVSCLWYQSNATKRWAWKSSVLIPKPQLIHI